MAARLAVKGPLTPSRRRRRRRRRRRALGCARGRPGSQTIREMAEGFSCFRAGCTAQINEGIVSISELMGVTSERARPQYDPENKNAQDNIYWSGGAGVTVGFGLVWYKVQFPVWDEGVRRFESVLLLI